MFLIIIGKLSIWNIQIIDFLYSKLKIKNNLLFQSIQFIFYILWFLIKINDIKKEKNQRLSKFENYLNNVQ